jgi:hypothetical protein
LTSVRDERRHATCLHPQSEEKPAGCEPEVIPSWVAGAWEFLVKDFWTSFPARSDDIFEAWKGERP